MKPIKTRDEYSKRFMRLFRLLSKKNDKWAEEIEKSDKDIDSEFEHLCDIRENTTGPIVTLFKAITVLQASLDLFPYRFLNCENLNELHEFHECRWSREDIEAATLIAEESMHYIIKNFPDVDFKYCEDHANALCVKFTSKENPEIYGFIEFYSGTLSTTVQYPDCGYCESELKLNDDWDRGETIYFGYAFLHKVIHRALQCRDCWISE